MRVPRSVPDRVYQNLGIGRAWAAWASLQPQEGEREFLTIAVLVRWFLLVGMILRFGIHFDEVNQLVTMLLLSLWAVYCVVLTLLAMFRPGNLQQVRSILVQVGVDSSLISLLYVQTGVPESDFFLFYILPLTLITRYQDRRTIVTYGGLLTTAFLAIISSFAFADPTEGLLILVRVFLPRAFMLAFLTMALVMHRLQATISEQLKMQRIQRRNTQLERISTSADQFMSDLVKRGRQAILDSIVQEAREVLKAEVCTLFLVERPDVMRIGASDGSPPGTVDKSREFLIRDGEKVGLTGYIAYHGEIFRRWGSGLTQHPAVMSAGPHDHLPSKYCYSLLGVPLKVGREPEKRLIGLLTVQNQLAESGRVKIDGGFADEDEVVLNMFGAKVTIALQAALEIGRLETSQKATKESSLVFTRASEHQLRDLLQGILSSSESLRHMYIDQSPGWEQDWSSLEEIQQSITESALRMRSTLDCLQQWAGIEELRRGITPVSAVVQLALEEYASELSDKEVRYVDPDRVVVVADANNLVEAFSIIVKNAVEAMEKGDRLVITVNREFETGDTLITFRNTGLPVPEVLLPKLGRTPVTSKKPGGKGFGLFLARRIVALHGGELVVGWDAEQAQTVVAVKLPCARYEA